MQCLCDNVANLTLDLRKGRSVSYLHESSTSPLALPFPRLTFAGTLAVESLHFLSAYPNLRRLKLLEQRLVDKTIVSGDVRVLFGSLISTKMGLPFERINLQIDEDKYDSCVIGLDLLIESLSLSPAYRRIFTYEGRFRGSNPFIREQLLENR